MTPGGSRRPVSRPVRHLRSSDAPRGVLVACALVLIVGAIYAQVRHFAFVNFDDGEYVTGNPAVMAGLTGAGLRSAFTSSWSANWHPLTWISHMADVQLVGPDPGAHHLVNAGLHAAAAIALFAFLRLATGAFWPSAVVAALFAAHPLGVEAVAWVSQRKSVLSTLFLFLTLGAWVSWTRRRGVGRYLL